MISGSRDWQDVNIIERAFWEHEPTKIIVGDARGADKIARQLCKRRNIPVEVFHADWKLYGRKAGPIRNQQMVDELPDKLLAFPQAHSKGTYDAIKRAKKAGIPVYVYRGD